MDWTPLWSARFYVIRGSQLQNILDQRLALSPFTTTRPPCSLVSENPLLGSWLLGPLFSGWEIHFCYLKSWVFSVREHLLSARPDRPQEPAWSQERWEDRWE